MILDNPIYGLLAQVYKDNKNIDGIDKKDMSVLKHCLAKHFDMYSQYRHLSNLADLAERMGDLDWEDQTCRKIDVIFLDGDGTAPKTKEV